MKQQRDEQLSALLDNALDDQQLTSFMQDLKCDPVAEAEAAQRYRLMGDVMRDELDQSSFMDISSAVHRAIEHEEMESLDSASIAQGRQKKSFDYTSLFSGWFKPVAGMAVAASVAMVTLVTFNTLQNTDSNQQVQLAQSVQPQIQLVNPEIARNVQVASTLKVKPKTPEQQRQLNGYLLQHSGYAGQSTIHGMMPYVRVVKVTDEK